MNAIPEKLGDAYRYITDALKECAGEQAKTEARYIIETRSAYEWSDILAHPQNQLDADCRQAIHDDVKERLAGKPLSRLYGCREFFGLPFILSPETLDPRPDTEILLETALDIIREKHEPLILDLGTGTGCILIALLHVMQNAHGVALDKSFAALKTAQQNAENCGVAPRVNFICGDWAASINAAFDLVVSNPPYIAREVIETLDAEVKDHDPILALCGGNDGLDAYKIIFSSLKNILKPDGVALFEIGFDQEDDVLRLAEDTGLKAKPAIRDLAGLARVVEISRGDK